MLQVHWLCRCLALRVSCVHTLKPFATVEAQQHVAAISATTLSLPLAGARVAATRDAARAAADAAAKAVEAVMRAKAELHKCARSSCDESRVMCM